MGGLAALVKLFAISPVKTTFLVGVAIVVIAVILNFTGKTWDGNRRVEEVYAFNFVKHTGDEDEKAVNFS